MKKIFWVLTALSCINFCKAQQNQTDTTVMETANVTSSKTWRKQSETGKIIHVIDQLTLQNNYGKSIGELLNQQSAIFIAGANNNFGSVQDVYARGSSKILFLLDGLPIYDASTISNSFDINTIAIESLERIEILKGAHSTLYGSDAVACVINFITKKNTAKTQHNVHVSGGSFGTIKASAGLLANNKTVSINAQYSFLRSAGISAAKDTANTNSFDRDGFRQHNINTSFSVQLSKKTKLNSQVNYNDYKTDADGAAFVDDNDFTIHNKNTNALLSLQHKTNKGLIVFNTGLSNVQRNYVNDSTDISGFSKFVKEKYTGNSYFSELFTQQKIHDKVELVAGADIRWLYSNQDYLSISSFGTYKTNIGKDSVKQNMKSVFLNIFLKNLDGFFFDAGARINHHSTFGTNATYSINPSYQIHKNIRFFANLSSAFKAPSLYQLYGPGVANRELKAENSTTREAGISYEKNSFKTRVAYFNRSIRNAIDYNLAEFVYFNNNRQKDFGAEWEASYQIKQWKLAANYTYLDGEVTTWKFRYNPSTFSYQINGDTTFNNLFRRPQHALNVNIQFEPNSRWMFASNIRTIGKRFEGQFMAAPIELKSYATVDLYCAYLFKKSARVYADIKNITNTKFMDVWGYNIRPINFMVGFQYIF